MRPADQIEIILRSATTTLDRERALCAEATRAAADGWKQTPPREYEPDDHEHDDHEPDDDEHDGGGDNGGGGENGGGHGPAGRPRPILARRDDDPERAAH